MIVISRMMVPAVAAGLLLAGISASQAQQFSNSNTTLTLISALPSGLSQSPVAGGTGGIKITFANGDSYVINPAQLTDNVARDGSGGGAFIKLSLIGNDILETSNQNTALDVSSLTYNFNTTIKDIASGTSKTFVIPFTFNSNFNEGSNGGDTLTFGTITPASQTIGAFPYSIDSLSFTPPGAPPQAGGKSPSPGAFSARVFSPTATPEPGAIAMLVGMGISGSAFILRRRRANK